MVIAHNRDWPTINGYSTWLPKGWDMEEPSKPSHPLPAKIPMPAPVKPSLTNGTNYNIDNTPYMMQWNLNVERELGGWVLTAGLLVLFVWLRRAQK